MRTLKLLAALLSYPSAELLEALPEIAEDLNKEMSLRATTQHALTALVAELKQEDLLGSQARYVAQFDLTRSTSLHLFEHIHGDSRDRGQAMVDLKALYARGGMLLSANELPDFLPALLEYLSTRPQTEIGDILGDCEHIVRAIGERLAEGDSPYRAIFAALLDLQGAAPLASRTLAAEIERSLDEDWQEAPVEFGPRAAFSEDLSKGQFVRFMDKRPRA